ncbi:hypothetical protein PTTG_25215 [Puccinia triticina 1-1 BBBD Race 1]|uniref:Uncharacterized protein n=1 Tax=Puccinia triticina (isolate 1-1 / race 1 (BBBD)) TaxID=630390 RepID=A0A180H3L4_PUCT1|nr:hypothetical protein PTTG_25215 [Puccinia triticina 1-1 BBBD Race 1]
MPAQTTKTPRLSALMIIGNISVLYGNSLTFPGVHDIVTLTCLETDYKDAKTVTQGSNRVYYAEESGTDWDSLSDVVQP